MTRAHALQAATTEARRALGNLVDYRRRHPLVFYILHRDAAARLERQGKPVRARIRRWLRDLYKRRALASEQAAQCQSVLECL